MGNVKRSLFRLFLIWEFVFSAPLPILLRRPYLPAFLQLPIKSQCPRYYNTCIYCDEYSQVPYQCAWMFYRPVEFPFPYTKVRFPAPPSGPVVPITFCGVCHRLDPRGPCGPSSPHGPSGPYGPFGPCGSVSCSPCDDPCASLPSIKYKYEQTICKDVIADRGSPAVIGPCPGPCVLGANITALPILC